jgi:DNA repair exonuclease SbcCD nuclease subunit
MEKIKILLTSDLHLGLERVNSLISGEERLSTFMKIISLAHKHNILLIAGDLIHDENIDASYPDVLKKEFSALLEAGKEIYYTPGSGELTKGGKLSPLLTGISTTFTFSDNSDYVVKSSIGEIFIYGLQNMSLNKGWNIARKGRDGFHIGLFYADFSPQLSGTPVVGCIKKDDMKKMDLDFFALGKSHAFKMFRFSNKILGACSGSAEPCSIDEYGDRFVVSLELDGNELCNIKRIAVNTGKILYNVMDCGTIINQKDLIEKIKSTYPVNSIINITLTGERDFVIEDDIKTELAGFFRNLKIVDISLPTLKVMVEENNNNCSLKGIFFRKLNERLKSSVTKKMNSEILVKIISQNNRKNNTRGAILCDF